MNVGQILETHLGWACAGIGNIINKSLAQYKSSNDHSVIGQSLEKVYGKDQYKNEISTLSKDEQKELAMNIANGVPIKTPVLMEHLKPKYQKCWVKLVSIKVAKHSYGMD